MKALVRNNIVIDIEKRDIDVYKYYHEDVAKMFVDCIEDVSIGDMYVDGIFMKPKEQEDEE